MYLGGGVASHGTDGALDHASGRVDIGLKSGRTVGRHCGGCVVEVFVYEVGEKLIEC